MKTVFVKKPVVFLLCLLLCLAPLCGTALPAAAQNETGVISVKLNSDINGLTAHDAERLIELRSSGVAYRAADGGPVLISDYAGTPVSGALKAGRTYFIYYTLTAAAGYTLPETLRDGDVEIECGKGVSVISTQLVQSDKRDDNGNLYTFRGVMIFARVVVDGNLFQRIIGVIYDRILKIRAWSLY